MYAYLYMSYAYLYTSYAYLYIMSYAYTLRSDTIVLISNTYPPFTFKSSLGSSLCYSFEIV